MVVFVLLLLGSSLLLPSLVCLLFFGLGKKTNVLSGSRAIQVYRLQGSTFEVKKHSKSIRDTVRVFVFLRVCFTLLLGRVGGAWKAVWTAQA